MPGFAERHTRRQRITGSFAASGRTVEGFISDKVTGRSGLSCKLVTTFRATRR